MNPTITLVGAGPGDPELISLKGIKALQKAKVVLYDALVHPDTLQYASKKALKIYVGKRANQHKYKQFEINQLLVDYALQYGNVVRLKGGDPFIFGRGYEEINYAEQAGIATEVIPGISSLNLLALQKTPLTCRGINHSFWCITATTSSGELSDDIYLATHSQATVVIFMGLRKLGQIIHIFQNAGKGDVPIAVIQNGSMETEKTVVGTIETIEEKVLAQHIRTPAIIMIGETVRLHPSFYKRENKAVEHFSTGKQPQQLHQAKPKKAKQLIQQAYQYIKQMYAFV